MKPLIYLAGPISADPIRYARQAIMLSNRMMLDGRVLPFVPQLSVMHQLVQPRTWEDWLEYDEGVIQHCHAMYRIAGDSPGADREEAFVRAGRDGAGRIPIFYSLDSMYVWAEAWARNRELVESVTAREHARRTKLYAPDARDLTTRVDL